jgi:hypothetical protein
MKKVARQSLWFMSFVLGAGGVCTYPHLQRAEATVTTIEASRSELTDAAVQAANPDPIIEDPNVRKCICRLWQLGGYGFRETEAGMDIVRSKEGTLSCRYWPFAHLYHRAASPDHWPLEDVAAIAHTHPRKGAIQHPTDHDYLNTLDDYVVAADGIFSAGKGCTDKKNKQLCTQQPAGPKWHKQWCE